MNWPFDFSVVMAVFNVEPFLREAIDSLVEQDFGFERIQLILVDDGSTDKSGSICDEYGQQYPDNIVVVHKENGGVASARNEGLKYASGRFLNFMDSDDKFTLNAFSEVFDFFILHEEETDLVTVPLRFFDATHGYHWQNDKFKKGNRVIDLYLDYRSPCMFVNATFYSERIKKHIFFDSYLVCGEDMKVNLQILSFKMKLGVVRTCEYLYRRRSVGEASLIQGAKKRHEWYFDYFTHLVDWAVNYYTAQFGFLPAFLQYELMCDIQWRFYENYSMEGVLSPKEKVLYKQRLADTLNYFDDKYILEQKWPDLEHKCMMLKYKYGQSPTLTDAYNDVIVHYGNTIICTLGSQYSMVEFLSIRHQTLRIEGYTKVTGIDWDEPITLYIKCNDIYYPCETYTRENINEYRFGDQLLFKGIPFCVEIPLDGIDDISCVELYLKYRETMILKRDIRYGKFSPIGREYVHSYFFTNGWIIQGKKAGITLKRCKKKERYLQEIKFLKELWKKNEQGNRHAVIARTVYHLLAPLVKKKIWLISDRPQSAGDNGEAFFEYVTKKQLPDVRPYFVLMKESSDYDRMRKKCRVVRYMSWRYKLLHLLADKIISSQADDIVINPFYNYSSQYRDLTQKQDFIFLQHGVTKDNVEQWFNRFRTNMKGFICSANPERNSILDGNYFYGEKEVWLTGLPRFDSLYDDNKKQISIIPTWRAYLVNNDGRTGIRTMKDRFGESSYYKMYFELLTNEKLRKAAKKYQYTLSFVCHPNMVDSIKYFNEIPDVLVCNSNDTSYKKIFAESSLLITDYSSVVFDFAYLRKPLFYYQSDSQEFFSGAHTLSKGYFDYERDGFGEVEYTLESTVDRIIEYMENDCRLKDKYRQRIENFFAFNDRNNCQRVFEKIVEMDRRNAND